MKDGNIYCRCGHAIISHDPANKHGFPCCVKGCNCKQFSRNTALKEVKSEEDSDPSS